MAHKVLVIDDSEVVLARVRGILEAAGFVVITRNSPFGSGATIVRERPDLVLLDLNMPALSGDDIVRHVRARRELDRTLVALYSDTDEAELPDIALRCGADGCLPKSASADRLLSFVRRCLAAGARASRPRAPTPSAWRAAS